MSVIMTLRVKADAAKIEAGAAGNPEGMRALMEKAKQHGVIAHRFYGSDNGDVMVLDEWPDAESFQRFFEETRSDIEPMMVRADMAGEPEVTFWRQLETGDEYGWGA
jgi:hypothetical protein